MSDATYIKIYGERNSGTKYLEALIALNLDVHILRGVETQWVGRQRREWIKDAFFKYNEARFLGWKHAVPPLSCILKMNAERRLILVFIVKNPYAYLLSLYRRPWEYKGMVPDTFENFIESPWATHGRDRLKRRVLPSPIQLWNEKNKAYWAVHQDERVRSLFIRYEDLLKDPERKIRELAAAHQIHCAQQFRPILKSLNKDTEERYEDYRNYYLNQKWKEKLKKKSLDIIGSKLDQESLRYFDYFLIN